MKKLFYIAQITCLILSLELNARHNGVYNYAFLTLSSDCYFSTINQIPNLDTNKFLRVIKVEMDAYLRRVISINGSQITFHRSKQRIVVDLNNIVNHYLDKYCSDQLVVFGGFSPTLANKINEIDIDRMNLPNTVDVDKVKNKIVIINEELNSELRDFIQLIYGADETSERPSHLPILPFLESADLYLLPVDDIPVLDPITGAPLITDGDLGERIVSLLESNNALIEILSHQLISLNKELIELKKEGLGFKQELGDIHQRIDGLEEAISEIRLNNINTSTAGNLKPISSTKSTLVFFDKNSIAIKREFHSSLNKIFLQLKRNPRYRIIITGYADKSGNATINNRISRQRAQKVSQYLFEKGVDKRQLLINFLGASQSMSENEGDRRVVIEWLSE